MSKPIRDLGSLTPAFEEVLIDGESFIITEASEDSVVQHRNVSSSAARYEGGKIVRMEGLHDAEPILAGMNIYLKKDWDKKGEPAQPQGVDVVRGWPSRIVTAIYETVRRLTPSMDPQPETVAEVDERIGQLVKRREEILRGNAENPPTGDSGST